MTLVLFLAQFGIKLLFSGIGGKMCDTNCLRIVWAWIFFVKSVIFNFLMCICSRYLDKQNVGDAFLNASELVCCENVAITKIYNYHLVSSIKFIHLISLMLNFFFYALFCIYVYIIYSFLSIRIKNIVLMVIFFLLKMHISCKILNLKLFLEKKSPPSSK